MSSQVRKRGVYNPADERSTIVLGCGAYRIGSSVEFDWCARNCTRNKILNCTRSYTFNYTFNCTRNCTLTTRLRRVRGPSDRWSSWAGAPPLMHPCAPVAEEASNSTSTAPTKRLRLLIPGAPCPASERSRSSATAQSWSTSTRRPSRPTTMSADLALASRQTLRLILTPTPTSWSFSNLTRIQPGDRLDRLRRVRASRYVNVAKGFAASDPDVRTPTLILAPTLTFRHAVQMPPTDASPLPDPSPNPNPILFQVRCALFRGDLARACARHLRARGGGRRRRVRRRTGAQQPRTAAGEERCASELS